MDAPKVPIRELFLQITKKKAEQRAKKTLFECANIKFLCAITDLNRECLAIEYAAKEKNK